MAAVKDSVKDSGILFLHRSVKDSGVILCRNPVGNLHSLIDGAIIL